MLLALGSWLDQAPIHVYVVINDDLSCFKSDFPGGLFMNIVSNESQLRINYSGA